ncbi:MAG: glycerate kinase type-2 family protein [Christensenellales bacterium]|jgi:glycerate 2-kinase
MDMLRQDANHIMAAAIKAALPDTAVKKAIAKLPAHEGKLVLVSVGKAAWQMAAAAVSALGNRINDGVVITKYDHAKGDLQNVRIFEAGHPIPDENSFKATQAAIDLVRPLGEHDLVLFLLSGGGSSLFEKPLISGDALRELTRQLLASGADIVEMNTVRKRLSAVKGGRFAQLCAPARVFSVVLSDIIGDPLAMIASGPAYPDSSTCEHALAVVEKYNLKFDPDTLNLLNIETPKFLDNVYTMITGSVRQLCETAAEESIKLGYRPIPLTVSLCCEAREAGSFLASIAAYYQDSKESLAFLAGGETVVRLTGSGLGGRNQEIALSAAQGIAGMQNTAVFSFGSDGTDGPTDAAGGYVDGTTALKLQAQGISIPGMLKNNDAYHALKATDSLIFTGATGTNVNDLTVLLIKR